MPVSLAFPLQNLMIAFGSGTAVGMNALLSRARWGAKQQEQVDRAANTGIFLFGCNYVLFALIGAFLSRPFFLAQTHDAEIVGYGVDYASICLIFSFGIFAQFCFERLLQSTGRTKLSMMTQLIGAVINIVLDPILIFGWFGLPRLEVAGAAIATVAGQIIAAIIGLFVNLKKNPEIHIRAKARPLARRDGGRNLPRGRAIDHHGFDRLGHDVRHEQDPHRLHHDGDGGLRRVFQSCRALSSCRSSA